MKTKTTQKNTPFNEGFIQLHRAILKWEWWDDVPVRNVFITCLLLANWKDKKWRGETIKRGSFITSRIRLAEKAGVTVMQTRYAINKLKVTSELSIKTTNKYTVVTVLNYDQYQKVTSKVTNNYPTNNQQITTTNKDNKDNKEKKDNRGDFEKILITWNDTMESKFKTLPEKNIEYWLTKYSLQEVLEAIKNIPYHEWLSDKAKPDMFFRQSDGKGNAVDRIGECLSVRRTNRMFDKNKQL